VIGHLLQRSLSGNKVVNLAAQRIVISAGEFIRDNLKYK